MNVGLFIPCYIDQFFPRVAVATLKLLEQLECEVDFPQGQTCCGQPMANAGFERESVGAMARFARCFKRQNYIVTPSGSCALHLREHGNKMVRGADHLWEHTYELCAFLTDVLQVNALPASFGHKVGLHASCHGLRGLRLGRASELCMRDFHKVRGLLELVDGLELVDLDRKDECCGFGGTFAVAEEAVSVKMGRDRVRDHLANGAEVITSTDMSCLMHMDGLIRREKLPLRVMHIAEILVSQVDG